MRNLNKETFKNILKVLYCAVVYPFAKRKMKYSIMDSNETIDYIISNQMSISRYGDGEYYIINGKVSNFQKNDDLLKVRLVEVLTTPIPNHLVCLPYSFISLGKYRSSTRKIWKNFISINYKTVNSTTPISRVYGDSLFTRFYMILDDKSKSLEQIAKIKKIWDGKKVCIVEGCFTKFGVDNDLLDNCQIISRILCPPVDAFSIYDDILSTVIENNDTETMILCALGMTATVLAYDLTKKGYRTIDIGHLDIEYIWAKSKASEKCPVAGKSVNEVGCNVPDSSTILSGENIIDLSNLIN